MVKKHLVGIVFFAVLVATGWAETLSPSLVATPPQPTWSDLTVQQKIVLAPLADDWDSMEYFRQKKWLSIVARFAAMTPEEQRRIQVQMQGWGKLTAEQRKLARENFKNANQLSAEKKQEFKRKWEEYVNLPEDEKEKFKQQATNKPAGLPARTTLANPLLPAPAPQSTPAPQANPALLSTPPPSPPPAPDAAPAAPAATAAAEPTSKP